MIMKFKICLLILIFGSAVWAQQSSPNAGTAAGQFLRMDLNPRSSALSGAFTAVGGNQNALFFNPAGLAELSNGSFSLNHTQWYEDIRMDNVLLAYKFDSKFGAAVSASYLWMPPIQGKDAFGTNTSKLTVSSSIIHFGFGYKVHPSLYAGIGIKYFQDNLAGFTADGYAIDAGLFIHLFIPGLSFGVSLQNAGGKIQYDKVRERIPFSYRSGLAYKVPGIGLRFAVDVIKAIDTDLQFAAGMEYVFKRSFFLRIGNRFSNSQALLPSYGAGFKIAGKYIFEYTFLAHEQLGYTHRAGFTLYFNTPASRKYHYSSAQKSIVLSPPRMVRTAVTKSSLVVKWDKVYGARYNVYARVSKKDKWKKLNRHPLYAASMEFKKPQHSTVIHIVVTSVVNGKESAHSKEATLEIH